MQDLLIDIKTMPQAFGGYHLLLVITCDQTNFTIAVPLRDQTAQTVAEALIYRVIYLFGPPRQIICDETTEFSSAIIRAILCMLNCRLKVISPYNHGSSKCERQIQTISEIIMKHLWDKGQRSSPYSSFTTDHSLGWLLSVVAFAFTLVVVVMAQIELGNVVRVYPETVQGLMFYSSKIYITKILACVTSAKSLLWSPRLVTSVK